MKKFLYAFVGGCCLAACAGNQKSDISGALSDVSTDTLLVQSYEIKASREQVVEYDTVVMKDGKFALNVGDTVLKQVVIAEKPLLKAGETPQAPKWMSFVLLPGKPVTIAGTFGNYTLSGDAFYDSWTECQAATSEYRAKIDSVRQLCTDLSRQGVAGDSIRKVYESVREWTELINKQSVDYINQHLDQDISVYLLSQTSMETIMDLIDKVSEKVQTGVMAPMYQYLKKNSDNEKARRKARENIKEGVLAPDFTLKDIQGKDFTLSSLRGKYVILDFWGSWCGWCIKGMPDMKKYYEKYKGKLEIVGVDCNDTADEWEAAVETHGLPWINVRNEGDPDISVIYGIQGYPTKIVIDKDGNIAKIVVGEDPEFYKYLDSLMK